MGVDRVGQPRATSPDLDHGPRLDRRRLVQGAIAASLAGATGGVSALTARAANITSHPGVLLEATAAPLSIGDVPAGACLEASLHVMMR